MVPPMASAAHPACGAAARCHGRETAAEIVRLRARRRRPERHAARFLLAALLSAVLLLTLLLTRIRVVERGAGRDEAARVAAPCCPAASRSRQIVATAGLLHLQLPVAQSAVTAIGYHHAGDGSLTLDPVGRQGNAGLFARLWHRLAGSERDEPRLVPAARRRAARAPRRSSSAPRRAPTSTRPVDGTVVGITDYVLSNRTYGARIDIRPHRRAVRRRLADAPARRPGPDRRLGRRRRPLEGRHRRRPHRRRAPGARPVHAGRGQQRLAVGAARRALSLASRRCAEDPLRRRRRRRAGPPGRRGAAAAAEGGARRSASASSTARTPPTASGSRPSSPTRLLAAGADVITLGNHTWRRSEISPYLADLRARDPAGELLAARPGPRADVRPAADGTPVAVINVLGSLFLEPAISMFELVDGLVDGGARADAGDRRRRPRRGDEREGRALALARRPVTAVLGTHTHVQTSDARVQRGGTAAITDVGMTGPARLRDRRQGRPRDPPDAHGDAGPLRDRRRRRPDRGRADRVRRVGPRYGDRGRFGVDYP